jgi:hypothetical protein
MPIDGQDIVNALLDAKRRGADSSKLAELHALLRGSPPCDILSDHATRIGQIIQGTYKEEQSVSKVVRQWIDSTDGIFNIRDCYSALNITAPNIKHSVIVQLGRLTAQSVIEKVGDRNGIYRLMPQGEEADMDYINANLDNHIVFDWPLGIQLKTRIFPKSVIIIAGVTGTGKTTLILDFIFRNQDKQPITLLNSEMSREAMKFKLSQYEDIPLNAWTFRMRRWRGRTDEIDPNGVTIIDYLSAPPDKPYLIKEPIEKILNRLDQGVCIICIQKKKGADWGMGGVWSAMDTTLNVNLEWGRVEVSKNRFREADQFKGLDMRSFDVRRGHIVATSGWYGDATDEDKKERKKKERREKKNKAEIDRQVSEYSDNVKELFPGASRLPGDDEDDFVHEE